MQIAYRIESLLEQGARTYIGRALRTSIECSSGGTLGQSQFSDAVRFPPLPSWIVGKLNDRHQAAGNRSYAVCIERFERQFR